jgi:IMP dehydrogenase
MTDVLDDERFLGRTFDDFLFRPQLGRTETRKSVALTSRLTAGLNLELPIVAANMDSVTGMEMAKSMALEGGLGVIHRGQSIERQADQVARVKRSHGAVIEKPLCLPRGATLSEARAFTRKHNITGILIEEEAGSGILAGLLTRRDMPWAKDVGERKVDEFMTPLERLHTAKAGVGAEEAERLLFEKRVERLPLVDDQRRIQGLITRKDLLFLKQRPFASKDDKGRLLTGAAIGVRGDFLDRAAALLEAGVDCLVIDIAHGHSEVMRQGVEAVKAKFDVPLICGNVATYEGALFLKELGVDAIKVGVGPGRGCRTRLETAAGIPQLQAVREAWCAVGDDVPIIADGGVKNDKDIFLALICGASSVMLGSALSGTDQSPGHVIVDPATHTKKKIYRGMTSPQAVLESLYDPDDDAEVESALSTAPEGQEIQVPYRGSVVDILARIRGHLASSVSYAGELNLRAAREKIVSDPMRYLVPLSEASRRESYER